MEERRVEPRYRIAVDEDILPDASPDILRECPMVAFGEPTRTAGPLLSAQCRATINNFNT